MSIEGPIVVKKVKKISRLKIASAIALPLVAAAIGYAYYPKSSNMFDGDVNGWEVSYFEGSERGYMSARKGNIAVVYQDTEAVEKIDFKARNPDSLAAKLEFISYTDQKGNERFCRRDSDPSSFDFEVRNQIFEAADRHYNAIRTQIVKDLQKKKLNRLTEIRDNLK